MFGVIMACCLAGFLCGLWDMHRAKKNYSSDSEEEFGQTTEGFDRGYYRQRRGMFDNFR